MTHAAYEALPAPVRAHYPWPGEFHDVGNGVMQHYLDEGPRDGAPLLMVHGNPTWSFYWRTLVGPLSDTYRCVAPDHVGCGLSDKPQDYDYTLSRHIANLVRLIERLDLRDVTLLVHDWGGAIGFGAALEVPDRIARVVIFNTGIFEGPLPWSIRLVRGALGKPIVRGLNGFVEVGLLRAIADRSRMRNGVALGYRAPYDSYANRVAHHRFIQDIPLEDDHPTRPLFLSIGERARQLADRPAMIVWGEQDFCFTTFYRDGFKERFPNAEVHSWPDASHWVVEDAHERIVPLLRDFLERT